tara:strand:- start:456 stop:914 length:459 start_codon:yes stop_codon:yes gene_type:complete
MAKKIFHINSAKKEKPVVDRRDFFRLSHDEIYPLDLCLMQNEQVFCTTIEDLNVRGFSCRLAELDIIHCGEPMSALFVLALEKPVIIRTEVFLVSIEEPKEQRVFHFRFFDEINNNNREMIRQYIIQKPFEPLETKNKENWHEKELESLVRG